MNTASVPVSKNSTPAEEKDASLKEILLYGSGHILNALSGNFYNLINVILLVVLEMNPLVLGFLLGIKTLWDGVADPIMAQISDHARTPWGRRRPFILAGGILLAIVFIGAAAFFPRDASMKTNAELSAQKQVQAASAQSGASQKKESTPAAKPQPKRGMIEGMIQGWEAFLSTDSTYHQHVCMYILVVVLLFTTANAIISVPYYALGIELCPSYDGRTRVVTYRSIIDKTAALASPWVLPFCLLPMFHTAVDGLLWFAIASSIVGVPAVVLMVMYSKERLASVAAKEKRGPGIFKSIWMTANNGHFLKILLLYQFIGYTNGIFTQVGLLLTIYWVYSGNAMAGATLGGYAGTLGVVVAFIALPLINISCRKFQKHCTLRYALIWMSIGTALKWFVVTPEHPYWQLILPFFFAVGISSVYTVLPTMMADVTDIDELRNGVRREGMFGAVMGFLMKVTGTLQPVLAGAIVVLAGFDPKLGAHQAPETIFRMRLMFSIIPAVLLLGALFILRRYPLTREYMVEVNEKLKVLRAQQASEAA